MQGSRFDGKIEKFIYPFRTGLRDEIMHIPHIIGVSGSKLSVCQLATGSALVPRRLRRTFRTFRTCWISNDGFLICNQCKVGCGLGARGWRCQANCAGSHFGAEHVIVVS